VAETEAVQQPFRARAYGPGVGIGEVGVDRTDALAVVGRFGLGQFSLEPAQRGVAVDRVIDRRAVERRGFLRDMRHPPALRVIDVALVGMQFAAQQREQARLAGAVGTDQADLVAGIERDVRGFEQHLGAAPERDLGKTYHRVLRPPRGKGRILRRLPRPRAKSGPGTVKSRAFVAGASP
jgi:hypothetical protein